MASATPLKGIELIDCAQANTKEGLQAAAYHCGYGENVSQFQAELKKVCQEKGIEINSFSDLIKLVEAPYHEIGPNNPTQL